jgi:hypothetical protein
MIFLSNEYKDWERDKIEEEKAWVQKYPFLHIRNIDGIIDTELKFPMISLEIPDGWYELFFQFCDDLKEVLIEEGYLDTFYFVQIKEKYNRLKCYSGHFETDKISQVLRKYEYLSQFVCTRCSKPATKEITQGYMESLCDTCWESQHRCYAFRDIEFDAEFQISTFGRSTGTVATVVDVSDEWNRYLKRIEVIE